MEKRENDAASGETPAQMGYGESSSAEQERQPPFRGTTPKPQHSSPSVSASPEQERPRQVPRLNSKPMSLELQERLIAALERHYPGKVRRAVDVCPVAINKTIDNEADALETIRRCDAEALSTQQ